MKWSFRFLPTIIAIICFAVSCDKKDPAPAPIADFTFEIAENGLVIFTNASLHATSYVWVFGDSASSTEISPTHIYTINKTYTVKLKATGDGGIEEITHDIDITNVLNKQGCLPVAIAECSPSSAPTNDPDRAYELLVGMWKWQHAYNTWPYNNKWTMYPYPHGCNMNVLFKEDHSFELWIGNTLKTSGYYAVDQEDITLSDDLLRNYGGPNVVHQYKMHLTISPDPYITEQSGPPQHYIPFYLSGLLTVSENCLELSKWRRDIHGFEYTSGNKFVK
jgi:PKD repeat protein